MQKTYSRRGQRPQLDTQVIHHLYVRAAVAISAEGDLYYEVRECSFKSSAVVRFLKNIQQAWKKKILLIWNGASIHTSSLVKELLAQQQQDPKIWLARFPPYSPELNRIEKLWQQMKYVWMNVKSRTIDILDQDVSHILDNFGTDFKLAF